MTPVKRQLLKRIAKVATVAFVLVGVILFLAIATPVRFRFEPWRRLPVLDHRMLPHLSAIFAAAFGAFFGSLSAFYLGRLQQQSDRREKRHAALIAAQYALMSQWNIVEAIRIQHLEDLRSDPSRFTKLKLYWFPMSPSFVPFHDLTFVLETKDPNILLQIHLAEQSYRGCAEALQMRNREKFYENPRVSHQIRNLETGAGVAAASQKDLIFLRQATDALYVSVDRTLPRLTSAIEELEKLIKSMFPGKQALHMIATNPSAAPET
jgi:hypothetical protein